MASVQVLTSIAIIVVSFVAGFAFYYFTSSLSASEKKHRLEEILSLLINFIIYIWVSKILLNITVFVRDPLAILAYPSNSFAFYLAMLFTFLHIGYKVKRHAFQAEKILFAFVPVFLFASFVFEFIQIVWNSNTYTWSYLGLLMVLLIAYMLLHDRAQYEIRSYFLLLVWCLGQLIIAFILPFTTVFGYLVAPWVLAILFVVILALLIYHNRKRVSV